MINTIKNNMASYNFIEFKADYDKLYKLKSSVVWRSAMELRPHQIPFMFKDIFNVLCDKYDYTFYKEIVLSELEAYQCLDTIEDMEIVEALKLFYVTDTYIGFIVEELLYYGLTEANQTVKRSTELDIIRKADLVVNNRDIQIKNLSFLDRRDFERAVLSYYRKNPNLYFIFYIQKRDNIYLTTINKYPFTHINELYNIQAFRSVKYFALNEYIQKHTNR